MDIPHRGPRRAISPPAIHIHDPAERFRHSSRSSSHNSASSPSMSSSIPMSIPNSRDPVPPPLPPPRHLADIADRGHNGQDIAWQWGNSHTDNRDWGKPTPSVAPGSSLYDGSLASRASVDDRLDFQRRTSSISTVKSADPRDSSYSKDEGYASLGTSMWSIKSVAFLSQHVPRAPEWHSQQDLDSYSALRIEGPQAIEEKQSFLP